VLHTPGITIPGKELTSLRDSVSDAVSMCREMWVKTRVQTPGIGAHFDVSAVSDRPIAHAGKGGTLNKNLGFAPPAITCRDFGT